MKQIKVYFIIILVQLLFTNVSAFETSDNDFVGSENEHIKIPNLDNIIDQEEDISNYTYISFDILNKITSKLKKIDLELGQILKFESLHIIVEKCTAAKSFVPDHFQALFKIEKQTQYNVKNIVFYGWLFSESDSLSTTEDPVYDFNINKCYN